jgi:hypothetical protein
LGGDRRVTFVIQAPPEGLSIEEHVQWQEERRREAHALGIQSFTMALGLADVR